MLLKTEHSGEMSVRAKVLQCFAVIFCVVVIIMSSCVVVIDKVERDKAFADRKMRLNESVSKTETMIKESSELVLTLAENDTIRYMLRDYDNMSTLEKYGVEREISQISNNYSNIKPEVAQIKLYKNKGAGEIITYNSVFDAKLLEGDELYKNAMDLRAAIIPQYALSADGKANLLRFSAIAQIVDYDGTVLGYVCAELDKNDVYTQCVSEKIEYNKYIVDETGAPVITANYAGDVVYSDEIKGVNKTKSFTHKMVRIDGKSCILLSSASNGYGQRIINVETASDFYAWRRRFGIAVFFVSCFTAMLFMLLVYKLSKEVSEPIAELCEAMEKSVVTDKKQKVKEIELLRKKYNSLLESQKVYLEEIKLSAQRQNEAEIKSMIAQINPHFMLNTLNSIAYKALENEQGEICGMIGKLGKLCKISYNLKSFLTTVNEEILYINLYMDLLKECFDNKFTYEFDMDEELYDAKMPRFILQPFVENSIIHGFENITYEGRILIKAYSENGVLIFKIIDNGNGIPPDIIEKLNGNTYNTEKYGIKNVRERIKGICGDGYGVEYSAKKKKGASVTITLPGGEDEDVYDNYCG